MENVNLEIEGFGSESIVELFGFGSGARDSLDQDELSFVRRVVRPAFAVVLREGPRTLDAQDGVLHVVGGMLAYQDAKDPLVRMNFVPTVRFDYPPVKGRTVVSLSHLQLPPGVPRRNPAGVRALRSVEFFFAERKGASGTLEADGIVTVVRVEGLSAAGMRALAAYAGL
jgi:hypothetical protein